MQRNDPRLTKPRAPRRRRASTLAVRRLGGPLLAIAVLVLACSGCGAEADLKIRPHLKPTPTPTPVP